MMEVGIILTFQREQHLPKVLTTCKVTPQGRFDENKLQIIHLFVKI